MLVKFKREKLTVMLEVQPGLSVYDAVKLLKSALNLPPDSILRIGSFEQNDWVAMENDALSKTIITNNTEYAFAEGEEPLLVEKPKDYDDMSEEISP